MSMNFRDRRFEEGMTLVEITIVIVIIAMLVAALGLGIRGKFGKAQEKIAQITISQIEGALDMYMVEMGNYPDSALGLNALRQNPGNSSNWNGPYLKKDPLDPWGKPFVYRIPGTHGTEYDLCSSGPDGADNTEDDICNWK